MDKFFLGLKQWFLDVQIFPVVLEQLIIGFLQHTEIRFRSFNSNELEISDGGRRVRCAKGTGWIAVVGLETFMKCRHRWRVDYRTINSFRGDYFEFAIGIAYPTYPDFLDTTSSADTCCDPIYEPISQDRKGEYNSITLEIDLQTSTLWVSHDDNLTRKIVKSNIPNLAQCTPYIGLRTISDVLITS